MGGRWVFSRLLCRLYHVCVIWLFFLYIKLLLICWDFSFCPNVPFLCYLTGIHGISEASWKGRLADMMRLQGEAALQQADSWWRGDPAPHLTHSTRAIWGRHGAQRWNTELDRDATHINWKFWDLWKGTDELPIDMFTRRIFFFSPSMFLISFI